MIKSYSLTVKLSAGSTEASVVDDVPLYDVPLDDVHCSADVESALVGRSSKEYSDTSG